MSDQPWLNCDECLCIFHLLEGCNPPDPLIIMGWNTSVISVRGETDRSVWPVFNAPSPICHQLDFNRGSEESQQQSESQQEYRIVVLFPLIGCNLGTIRDLLTLKRFSSKSMLSSWLLVLKTRQNGIFFNLIMLFWKSMLSLWLTRNRMATKGNRVNRNHPCQIGYCLTTNNL